MKGKNNSSQITKSSLRKELLASEKRLEKKFATRDYLDRRFDNFAKAFRDELRFYMNSLLEDIQKELSKFKNQVFPLTEPLAKELETRQQDRAIAANQMSEVRHELQELDQRVTKFEHPRAT